jgi:hypothetical protein
MTWFSKFKGMKWLSWTILGGVAVILIFIVRGLFNGPKTPGRRLPEVPDTLKKKIAAAEEEALVSRVRAKAEAEEANKQLEEIASVEDGAKRRQRLAEYLDTL